MTENLHVVQDDNGKEMLRSLLGTSERHRIPSRRDGRAGHEVSESSRHDAIGLN